MSRRLCLLDPMGLACVALAGVCLGVAVWGVSAGHTGQVVLGGLVGLVLGFVAWILGREAEENIVFDRGYFWREAHALGPGETLASDDLAELTAADLAERRS